MADCEGMAIRINFSISIYTLLSAKKERRTHIKEKKKLVTEETATEITVDEQQAAKKKIQEMNLLDDFLFGSVVTSSEVGEQFVKSLLKIIFGREFKHLSVTAQKVFYGADSDLHGARLDVCIEPTAEEFEGRATVYDLEPDRNSSAADKRALPRRIRFYQGKLTMGELRAGDDYDKLKNVVIVMIVPYDPFGLNRMVYTIKNKCIEEPEMEYDDGASAVFLYTKGTKGASNEALKQLLHYMEDSTRNNAVNDDLRRIHDMVETVKKDPEMSIAYLRLREKLRRSEREGEKKGRITGNFERLVTQVCKKMQKNQSMVKIAEDLVEEVSVIAPIYHAAEKFAPEYDPELVLEQINITDSVSD